MPKEIREAVKNVLSGNWSPFAAQKEALIVSLCGYYSANAIPDEIRQEASKLNSQIPTLKALYKLIDAVEENRKKDFRWEPHFPKENLPSQITMNPTFNVQESDDTSLVEEIEKLRAELKRDTVDIVCLIAYIRKRAEEEGDLEKEN